MTSKLSHSTDSRYCLPGFPRIVEKSGGGGYVSKATPVGCSFPFGVQTILCRALACVITGMSHKKRDSVKVL